MVRKTQRLNPQKCRQGLLVFLCLFISYYELMSDVLAIETGLVGRVLGNWLLPRPTYETKLAFRVSSFLTFGTLTLES